MKIPTIICSLLTVLILCIFSGAAARAEPFSIKNVKGDVYRFTDNRHHGVFVVAKNSILLVDPLNEDAARWLRTELAKRFNLPVTHVVYSHNHSDHIYGAGIFEAPGTIFIAHELARQDIEQTGAATVVPQITFKKNMTVSLHDHDIELRYHGPNDGRGSISILVRPENVLFVADWIVVGRMPWQKLWSYDIFGMINATKEVLDLNFDQFVGAHADTGTKADVQRYLDYLQSLYSEVIKGILAGKSLEQLKEEIRLPEYRDLKHYNEWLELNVEGVHERLMEESGMGWRSDLKK